jgi:hypothetical protein
MGKHYFVGDRGMSRKGDRPLTHNQGRSFRLRHYPGFATVAEQGLIANGLNLNPASGNSSLSSRGKLWGIFSAVS